MLQLHWIYFGSKNYAKVTVTKVNYVSWGSINTAVIEKVVEGKVKHLNDTIKFGITVSEKFDFLKKGDTKIISFENSGRINQQPYLTAIDGLVNKREEILSMPILLVNFLIAAHLSI